MHSKLACYMPLFNCACMFTGPRSLAFEKHLTPHVLLYIRAWGCKSGVSILTIYSHVQLTGNYENENHSYN